MGDLPFISVIHCHGLAALMECSGLIAIPCLYFHCSLSYTWAYCNSRTNLGEMIRQLLSTFNDAECNQLNFNLIAIPQYLVSMAKINNAICPGSYKLMHHLKSHFFQLFILST
jgi:hypothetical protein